MAVVKLVLLSLWMVFSFAIVGSGWDNEDTGELFAGLASAAMCIMAIKLYLL